MAAAHGSWLMAHDSWLILMVMDTLQLRFFSWSFSTEYLRNDYFHKNAIMLVPIQG